MSDNARRHAAIGAASLLFCGLNHAAVAQTAPAPATTLPDVTVAAPEHHHAPSAPQKPRRHAAAGSARRARRTAAVPATPGSAEQQQAAAVAGQNARLDQARGNLLAPGGANSYGMSRQLLESLPQGTNTTLDKALLQAPGVSQDSAASGNLHVRNEHANLQYRINGVMLPDGVGAFGQIIDTGIVGSMALITGALPAQYGLRTAGVLDIQTKADAFNNSGSVSVYGGSHGTFTTSVDYGGTIGQTQYYVSGRYFGSDVGIENPTPAYNAIHDRTDQEKGFAYISTAIDPTSRLTYIGGVSNGNYQIPNNPGQPPAFTAFGVSNFDSALLNERQQEFNQFNVVAYQKSADGLDYQIAYFNRYSQLHFTPDPVGDLVFNGVASDVYRQSYINGIQEDTSYRLGFAHTLKFGFSVSAERSLVNNGSTVLPLDDAGNPVDAPFSVFDSNTKTGYMFSSYVADEWKITNQLTLNAGLRFDQMWQFVDANQLSPRISLTWKPYEGTTFHAGYARNFTPPEQVLAAPTNLALVQNTTAQPAVSANDPVLPERSHVFDVGVTQKVYAIPGLEVGMDAYYKIATDLLDDGQFGAAYVLTAFNYAKGTNEGVELTARYDHDNLHLYGNVAVARQVATNVVSNQYLFDPDELAFIANNYVNTDHAQALTASVGGWYQWHDTKFSASLIYGSGLRDGFANTGTVPPYTQVNVGVSHDFNIVAPNKPTTVRFDIVNLFDSVYQIRDGSGIGVFAPQFGPRRGFYAGITQKF
ncbi:TonB-dependent receptor [Bradyrhizobium tropiciagri]|uniref:TonB-dependent receptor n=1 Tax=Bradyrhizobium tropiciagri TaxID=312253 RepID=UPI001BABFC66|nr:TonB-dependent receptor [Bradyrhizobium tropiciagri]MBR0870417.1 TonB-dependent receptor [Bradyrhizobium tropiciagri]